MKAPGCDLIRMSDLKTIPDKVSPVLAKLINMSVCSGKFPVGLKQALIRPIYKKGSPKHFFNYRPIAILSSVDKVIEKCIVQQLSSYLSNNMILNECQYGFQKGKSTDTLLARFTDEVNTYLANKKVVLAVFFDFSKAFDTLDTSTLLLAMSECGVREPLNHWFRDYLTGRSYCVRVGSALSVERQVSCGVPQGSCTGPVSYLMHVNSLCGVLRHCSAYMFADDLCILCAGSASELPDICRLVQHDVDAVTRWSHDNGIVLNVDKTNLLLIRSPYLKVSNLSTPIITHDFSCIHNHMLDCCCNPISRVKCVTYLGVKVDEHFSWTYHVDFIYSKLKVLLGRFYYLRFKVPLHILKYLYVSLVESIIGYALDCYGLTTKTNLNKLECIQVRFLKLLVTNKIKDKNKKDYRNLFKICNILPVSLKHKYLLVLNNHGGREHTQLKLHRNDACDTRSMSAGKFVVPRVFNYYGDRCLQKRLPYILNSLPTDIRQEAVKAKIGRKLYSYLIKNI